MSITATELKLNLGKYLQMAEHEDIFITRNGKIVAKLSNPNADRVEMAKSLLGVIPADITLEEAKAEMSCKNGNPFIRLQWRLSFPYPTDAARASSLQNQSRISITSCGAASIMRMKCVNSSISCSHSLRLKTPSLPTASLQSAPL